ncbi:MAG: RidA family protein [Rikenellaceae bacterium]
MNRVISSPEAPAAIGPYSQAIEASGMIYVSGQLPLNPKTNQMPEDIEAQTAQALDNIAAILNAAGCSMNHVVKTTVLLADMNDFAAMNEVYASYFTSMKPARACFQVARLPKDAKIEIEVVASK